MTEEILETPNPSPEVEQLLLFGRTSEAVALYAKQADLDEATARTVIERLADE